MAKLSIVRIDYRMIHGQTVVKWMNYNPVERIILVNDELAADDFLSDIYKMAANGKPTDIIPMSKLNETLDKADDKVMLIFKDVKDACTCYKEVFKFSELNVGAVQKGTGRIDICPGVSLSKEEYDMLAEIYAAGVKVFLQPIPENSQQSFESIKGKFNK